MNDRLSSETFAAQRLEDFIPQVGVRLGSPLTLYLSIKPGNCATPPSVPTGALACGLIAPLCSFGRSEEVTPGMKSLLGYSSPANRTGEDLHDDN